MIEFEEALSIVLSGVTTTGSERADFADALNRVLAEDLCSDVDMPPFDKAAMDGYACRRNDLDGELEVIEVLAAGDIPSRDIAEGQCSKIMTGAMVPRGADTVIMIEQCRETGEGKIRFAARKTMSNIATKGEDVKKGDVICRAGTLILPRHIAMLAASGSTRPLLAKQPRVGILSTGDELVEPGEVPGPGKIRNSNGIQLAAQSRAAGCIPNYMGIVPDDAKATELAIGQALATNDLVLISGGVSMGDFDFVPGIMKKNNVDILFQKVAVKPGRPTVFGKSGTTPIFGLPGNPVSSYINFETFVKPLIYKMMGHDYHPLELKIPMGVSFKRKKADRLEFLPVIINSQGEAVPARYHGSAHIHAISLSVGLMCIPKGILNIEKGELADVRPL